MLNTILLIIAILMIPATLIFINKMNRIKKAKEPIPCCSYQAPFISESYMPPLPKPTTYLIVSTWSEGYSRYFKNKLISSDTSVSDVCLIAESFTRKHSAGFPIDVAYSVYDITDSANVKVIKSENVRLK